MSHSVDTGPAWAHARLQEAVQRFQQGNLPEALSGCEQVLAIQPRNPDALQLLSMLAFHAGHFQKAADSIGKLLEMDSGNAFLHFNRAAALQQLEKFPEALAGYDRAVALNTSFAEAYSNRSVVLAKLNEAPAALASCDRAIALKPGLPEAHYNRGIALEKLGRLSEAVQCYSEAIRRRPDYPEALLNRGNLLRTLGDLEAAVASYDAAVAVRPHYLAGYGNRGNVHMQLRNWAAALADYDRAIAIKPDDAVNYSNRGNVFKELGEWQRALASYDQALALAPDFAEAHLNRGDTLRELRQYEASLASLERAMTLKPDLPGARALSLNVKLQISDWSGFETELAELVTLVEKGAAAWNPYGLITLLESPALQHAAAQQWVNEHFPAAVALPAIPKRPRRSKIKLGYFSADFRMHPVSVLIAEMLELHARNRFELIAVEFGADRRDDMTSRLERAFDEVVDARKLSDRELALLCRRLEVDIAVDLGGFTQGARPGVFSMRAAPIQMSYLGYAGTMGAPFMDYMIADRFTVPDEALPYFSEKIIRLPDSFMVNDSTRAIASTLFTRSQFGLPEEGTIFCCFNNTYKIMPATFDSWMRILHGVPGSVLWLAAASPTVRANLRLEASRRGVDAGRLVFAEHLQSLPEHLGRLRLADLCLDTLPYNAHATAVDALWVGLPVLTLTGEAFAGRVATSLLHNVGLPELVATTREQYEALAIELGNDRLRMQALRQKLAINRLSTPLFDTARFTRTIEAAYSAVYERYIGGLPTDHVRIGRE